MKHQWPAESSELAQRIRVHDWAATPMGPITGWPQHLKTAVDIMLDQQLPMCVLWGREGVQVYNDAYAKSLAAKHPAMLGRPMTELETGVWPIEQVFGGETVNIKDARHLSTLSPLRDPEGAVAGALLIVVDTPDISRQHLLLAELQHRVRNVLATVRSIVRRTMHTSETIEDLSMHLEGRINALARTQVILSRNPGAGVDLETILREEMLSQAGSEGQITIEGPAVELSPKAAEVITLALHELTTNSIKYGALRETGGRIAIVWRTQEKAGDSWLRLAWVESNVKIIAAAPRREGFGTELITGRVPYELLGTGSLELKPGGMHATIEFPLRSGGSILETDGGDVLGSSTV